LLDSAGDDGAALTVGRLAVPGKPRSYPGPVGADLLGGITVARLAGEVVGLSFELSLSAA